MANPQQQHERLPAWWPKPEESQQYGLLVAQLDEPDHVRPRCLPVLFKKTKKTAVHALKEGGKTKVY